MVFSCFGIGPCCQAPLVPDDHTELSREELKRLYERSISLNGGRLYVHGIFARANTRNNNKRVYPKHILEREVSRFEAEHIVPGTALGELDHPNYASKYFKCLNLPNVSHQVLEVAWKGDQLWGTIEVLPTPSGLLLWELYSRGVKLGVSSRGWASLRSDPASKCVFVDDDFELITFDFVTEPSTRGAYLAPVQRKYKRTVPDQQKMVSISHLGHGVVAMEKVSRVPGPVVLVQRIAELQRASAAALSAMPPGAPLPCGPGVLSAAGSAGALPPSFKPSGLDNLLCYGHYVVHQSAPYLDREQHARDYRAHLVIFTARAHLADERLNTGTLSRGDIDNVILNKLVTKDSFDPASTSFATRLDQPPHYRLCAGSAAAALAASAEGLGLAGGGGVGPSHAAAAAAAETQGPSGIDASYAVVHAACRNGDLESWAMHPNVLNPSPDGSGGTGQPPGHHHHPGPGPGLATNGSGGIKILPVVVPAGGLPGKHGSGPGAFRSGSAGACGPNGLLPGPAPPLAQGEDEALRAWLAQLPGGESMLQGFLEIRASLIAFAALYAVHQKRVESSLLKAVGAGRGIGEGVTGSGHLHPYGQAHGHVQGHGHHQPQYAQHVAQQGLSYHTQHAPPYRHAVPPPSLPPLQQSRSHGAGSGAFGPGPGVGSHPYAHAHHAHAQHQRT
ncbi:hypothetical protein HYH03_011671 [Edaphochlamys debaryana]|uniref:Uncharacterized protein n=1 Tax=Edaphochlamys debaryana TaxID=47281 RepID=A0A835XU96_9CHLO|nr:hypothetical protein HYH03_011671 [Edaphochlamys debaryana]|eukprot:KAG2489869.1 hypothetical protein HYH03_011671 [Edaphochlamys debaryana]